jgi:hypothetical protein
MTEDMQLRNLSASTRRVYLHYIFGLARFYLISPDLLSMEEIREYQLYLRSQHAAGQPHDTSPSQPLTPGVHRIIMFSVTEDME